MLAVRKFIQHDSSRTATVLTYYSLLNIVPLFAVMFAMAKGFGLKKFVVKQIAEMAQKANWQASVTDQLINFAESVLTQARGGIIAGVGVVLLLWTVISILGKIEDSFNIIWEVKKPRTLMRKFTDYLTILLIAPGASRDIEQHYNCGDKSDKRHCTEYQTPGGVQFRNIFVVEIVSLFYHVASFDRFISYYAQ